MKLTFQPTKHDVQSFLNEAKEKLRNEGQEGLLFILRRNKEKENIEYTNEYCLNQLEYDSEDVMAEILGLEVFHYVESLPDNKSEKLELLHVFVKEIQGRQVYIKIRMKDVGEGKMVLCISFHFAEHQVNHFPYG